MTPEQLASQARKKLLEVMYHLEVCNPSGCDCFKTATTALQAAKNEEREKLAKWMLERGYTTGHGDTTEDLLKELGDQLRKA